MGNKLVYKGYNVGETTQVSVMSTPTADNSGAIVQYVGATNANYINGYFYKCVSDGGVTPTYSWEKIQVSDGGDTIQVETMPTASEDELGNIYEFVGTTTANYINGRFYRCVSDGASTPTYSWEEVDFGDSTPHWTGTRAEYEAIKDTLEIGTVVCITDDYDSGLEVVDVIEDGNMNPVTSNAVAEITNHGLSTLTWNTTYIDLGTWATGGILEKCGIIQFTKIFTVKAGIPAGTIICSGLPRPAMNIEIPVAWDADTARGGFFFTTNGDISVWADVTTDTNCRINLVYIKAQ